jgi:hypothetical protein
MANDLEQRRRAIADALRQIMAEPLPERQRVAAAAPSVPGPVTDSALTLPASSLPMPAESAESVAGDDAARATEDRLLTEEWDEQERAGRGEPMVPPLESVGSMSRMASLALFGHA